MGGERWVFWMRRNELIPPHLLDPRTTLRMLCCSINGKGVRFECLYEYVNRVLSTIRLGAIRPIAGPVTVPRYLLNAS